MKTLLTITAAVEAGTGVALAVVPSWVVRVLLGSPIGSSGGPIIGRILGAALFALGVACWTMRDEAPNRAAVLVTAMLLYNLAVVALLGHARINLGMPGVGLWPAVFLHSALAASCVAGLRAAGRTQGVRPSGHSGRGQVGH